MRVVALTKAEHEALADFFPTITLANVVVPDTPLHRALSKLVPGKLPRSMRPQGPVGTPAREVEPFWPCERGEAEPCEGLRHDCM